jgi:hypothetical protein
MVGTRGLGYAGAFMSVDTEFAARGRRVSCRQRGDPVAASAEITRPLTPASWVWIIRRDGACISRCVR